MKHYLSLFLLLASFTGCKKVTPELVPDYFLGHWQSDKTRIVTKTGGGAILSDIALPERYTFDVTATTIVCTPPAVVAGAAPLPVYLSYTRTGESLAVTGGSWQGIETYVRALTATSCLYEEHLPSTAGNTQLIYFNLYR